MRDSDSTIRVHVPAIRPPSRNVITQTHVAWTLILIAALAFVYAVIMMNCNVCE